MSLLVFGRPTAIRPLPPALASMGSAQKRIENFFAAPQSKRAKSAGGEAAAAGPAGGEASTSAAAQPAAPPAPAAPRRSVEELRAAQAAELAAMRATASANGALAKQAVLRAEAEGALPALTALLVEPSWRALLADQLEAPYFRSLQTFVEAEWGGTAPVFPPKDAIFRALNGCPVDQVRVVILGQDPYHGLGQAMGLSFSVPRGKPVPSSLRNMYKELRDDLGCAPAPHGCLEKWSHQGVLLLNAVLTVRSGQPASHTKKGWEAFTDEAVARLSRERSGLVFLLWGKYAQERGRVIDRSRHHVLTAPHPSGLSAHRGFFGCRHFSQTNALLEAAGLLPVDWSVE
jgi:uracil-DNA glycosylase